MSDRPQYPSYPNGDGSDGQPWTPPADPAPPIYGQEPPAYGQMQPPSTPPPGYPPPGYGQHTYGYAPLPSQSANGKSVTAMVLGIVSILFCYLGVLIGPAAIVFAVLGKNELDARPGAQTGRGMATAGLVTGIIGTVIWAAVIVLLIIGLSVE